MRILMLGMGWFPDQPGGLNRYFRGLFEQLRVEGVDVHAVVVGPAGDAPGDVNAVSSRTAPLPLRLAGFRTGAKRQADVVDAHFALYAVPFIGRRRGRPLVVHFHGPWAEESRSAGASGLVAQVKRTLERRLYRRADAIVVLSRAFGRVAVERYGADPNRIRVISPGVDLERYAPGDRMAARADLGIPGSGRVVVCVRRLVPRMGVDMLLRAWASTPRQPEDILVVVGDGPERPRLEELASSLGVPVRWAGRVAESSLPLYYRAADVSVVPSAELEGFGLVVLESLASGTPVVVTAVGGLPETVEGWHDDLSVEPTAKAIAERLAEPFPDADECRLHAERFSWHAAVMRHLELYSELVGRRRRVVYLGHTAALSGGELALLRLLPALDVDAHVILAEDGPLVERLAAAGLSVEVLPMHPATRATRRDALAPLAALRAVGYSLKVARRLRELRPDIVHANTLKACLYGGLAARLTGTPAVWHVRDRVADDYLPPRMAAAIRALTRVVPSAVIANSRATLETLPRVAISAVVPSPIDVPQSSARQRERLRIGMVGRIAPWKGQHVFVEALTRAFPDGGVDAVVIGAPLFGDDEVEYLERIREQAGRGAVEVEFTGFRDNVAAELAQLDVFVHASLIPEPFGQVVIEGMAAGLPIVAAAGGGPLEFVDNGVDGLLYEPGNASALAVLLARLAADPELRARLGAAARAKGATYTPEWAADQVQAVYERVIRR
jgi:glycosyltransferase involved in cell wall biosynthesis